MKRKKWLSLALCVGLIGALTLGGCGNGNGGSENKDGQTDQGTQTDDTGAAEDTEERTPLVLNKAAPVSSAGWIVGA